VERFFRYILNANVDRAAFQARVESQESKPLTELAMTLADRIRQEGHRQGLQEGHQEGRLEGETLSRRQSLLEILEVRFGTLPGGLAETISVISDPDRLRALHRSALTCPHLEAFASCL
jgi:hypothetical protein